MDHKLWQSYPRGFGLSLLSDHLVSRGASSRAGRLGNNGFTRCSATRQLARSLRRVSCKRQRLPVLDGRAGFRLDLVKRESGLLIVRSTPGHILTHLKRRGCRERAKWLNPEPLPQPPIPILQRREAAGRKGLLSLLPACGRAVRFKFEFPSVRRGISTGRVRLAI
jgi:hypothetical protein